jgi:hypothetical protein
MVLITGAAGIEASRAIEVVATTPVLPTASTATAATVFCTSVTPTLSAKPAPMLPDTRVVPAAGAWVLTDQLPAADAVVS